MKKILVISLCLLNLYFYSQKIQQVAIPQQPQSDPTVVIFTYDDAGNQVFRGPTGPICVSCRGAESESSLADQMENKIQTAPVPVKTDLTVIWDLSIKDYISKIELLPYNAFNIMETVNVSSLTDNSYVFRMSNYSYGVYYLRFYLTDGSIYTRTVTKN